MVDAGVLGHLDSPVYLAGVALAGAIFSLMFMGMNFLRMGTTGIAAQHFGSGDGAGLRQSIWQAIIVALAIASALVALQYPIASIAWQLLDAEPDIEQAGRIYFHIRIWGAPATLINFALIGWFIGAQNARVPLLIVLTTNVINIVLDLVFVVGLGMKTDGVAIASVIAETSGMLVGLYCLRRALSKWPAPMNAHALTRLSSYSRFFSVNGNIFVRTVTLVGTLAFFTAQSSRFGASIVAANAILFNFQYLLSYGLDGLANAAEALVGKAWGARSGAALRRAVRLTLAWSVGLAVAFSAAYAVTGVPLINLLTDIPEVRAAAIMFLPWMILSPIVSVFSFLYDGVFVGTTWAREMRNIMLASTLLIFIPAWYLTYGWNNHGLWFALTLFMAARGIGMAIAYQYKLNSAATRDWLAGGATK